MRAVSAIRRVRRTLLGLLGGLALGSLIVEVLVRVIERVLSPREIEVLAADLSSCSGPEEAFEVLSGFDGLEWTWDLWELISDCSSVSDWLDVLEWLNEVPEVDFDVFDLIPDLDLDIDLDF